MPGLAEHTQPDFDIIQENHQLKSVVKVKVEWVETHQDIKHPEQVLSTPAKLNCMADKDACKYMAQFNNFRSILPILPSTTAVFVVKGIVVTCNM
eukprot:2610132-Ditylum_brightwellii.AAC.1